MYNYLPGHSCRNVGVEHEKKTAVRSVSFTSFLPSSSGHCTFLLAVLKIAPRMFYWALTAVVTIVKIAEFGLQVIIKSL